MVLLAVTIPAMAGNRLGNAAGDLAALPGQRCRVFMGRGMVVAPTPEDFYMRPPAMVRFAAGDDGAVEGPGSQTVRFGCSALPVTAVPGCGYVFDRWSDGVAANPRTLSNVTQDQMLTAVFRVAGAVGPRGEFLAVVDARSRALWVLTGTYPASAPSCPFVLNLVHDARGRLGGLATVTLDANHACDLGVRGCARGSEGSVTMRCTMRGAGARKADTAPLMLNLAVTTACGELEGWMRGSIAKDDGPTPVDEEVVLPLPGDMDGTWRLRFRLDEARRGIAGTAVLRLSNGVEHTFAVRGRTGPNHVVVLSLTGAATDPAARAIKIKTTITPLEGGWARLESFSGRAYGQALAW